MKGHANDEENKIDEKQYGKVNGRKAKEMKSKRNDKQMYEHVKEKKSTDKETQR